MNKNSINNHYLTENKATYKSISLCNSISKNNLSFDNDNEIKTQKIKNKQPLSNIINTNYIKNYKNSNYKLNRNFKEYDLSYNKTDLDRSKNNSYLSFDKIECFNDVLNSCKKLSIVNEDNVNDNIYEESIIHNNNNNNITFNNENKDYLDSLNNISDNEINDYFDFYKQKEKAENAYNELNKQNEIKYKSFDINSSLDNYNKTDDKLHINNNIEDYIINVDYNTSTMFNDYYNKSYKRRKLENTIK